VCSRLLNNGVVCRLVLLCDRISKASHIQLKFITVLSCLSNTSITLLFYCVRNFLVLAS